MGQGPARGMTGADRFSLDGVEFVTSWDRPSVSGSLTLLKSMRMVRLYEDLLATYPRPRMVELGISQGGSVALLALMARPEKLIAVELSSEPIEPLLEVIRDKGLHDTVRPYFGVDQADQARLAEILADEVGEAPLDVVVDDASHLYDQTLASFEVLFPRLRPGGVYVIEDWTWQDVMAEALVASLTEDHPLYPQFLERVVERMEGRSPPERPLSLISLELVLAQAQSKGVVASVKVDEDWIVVHRGDAPIDPRGFTLRSIYTDSFGLLAGGSPSPPAGPPAGPL